MLNKKLLVLITIMLCGCNNTSQKFDSSISKSNDNSIQKISENENFNEKLVTLLDEGKYDQAFSIVNKKVEQNDSNAENAMGILYLNGFWVQKDQQKALEWFEKSVKNDGNASSYYNIAAIIMGYPESKRNLKKIFEYNSKAVEGKHPDAYNLQGILYLNGIYVDKDKNKAFNLFQEGAKLGSRSAQYNLASCYQDGNGISKNLEKAYFWYNKAHEQDNPLATIRLASLYANGEYVGRDLNKAIQLLYPIKDDIEVAEYNFRLYCSKVKDVKCDVP